MKYKKILRSLLAAVMAVCLTGCIRVKIDIDVKKNGKADISVLYATQDGLSAMGGSTGPLGLTLEQAEEYRSEGWDVADYAEDNYTGYVLTQKDMDLSKADFPDAGEGSVRKEGSLYIVDLRLFSEEDQGDLKTYGSLIKSAGGYFTVRVNLPVKPEKHNATSVSEDGKTLEWDILEMDAGEPVHLEVKLPNFTIYIIIGLLAAACAVFFVLWKQSGKDKNIQEIVPVQEDAEKDTGEVDKPDSMDEEPEPDLPSEEKP